MLMLESKNVSDKQIISKLRAAMKASTRDSYSIYVSAKNFYKGRCGSFIGNKVIKYIH